MLCQKHEVTSLPSIFMWDEFVVEPQDVLETRYNEDGYLERLVQWKGLPPHENS